LLELLRKLIAVSLSSTPFGLSSQRVCLDFISKKYIANYFYGVLAIVINI